MQEDHRVGLADGLPGALDADALHLVGGLLVAAQPGGVDDVQRHALDLDRLAHAVACRAGDRRDDGELRTGQRVQQRALADVGLAGEHDVQPLAQQRTAARLRERGVDGGDDAVELGARAGVREEVELLLGKVERRLDQRAKSNEARGERVHPAGEGAGQRARRRTGRRLGAGVDEVGHRLGLRQVELVVEEGPLGELARLRQPRLGVGGLQRLQAARQQQLQHHRAAVRLQLEHVFAGVRVRRREVDRESAVQFGAAVADERQQRGLPRHERAAADRGNERR